MSSASLKEGLRSFMLKLRATVLATFFSAVLKAPHCCRLSCTVAKKCTADGQHVFIVYGTKSNRTTAYRVFHFGEGRKERRDGVKDKEVAAVAALTVFIAPTSRLKQ